MTYILPGQWWERLGQVVYLPPSMDPNVDDPQFTGWRRVTPAEANAALEWPEPPRASLDLTPTQARPKPA